jgi:DNA polymerase (family 10)
MSVHNEEIARVFDEMAELLALKSENPFRIRAYQRAALNIRGHRQELSDLVRQAAGAGKEPRTELDAIPGIGEDLAAKILEIIATGKCRALERLRKQVPHGLLELLHLPGLGPKRVQILFTQLKVRSREDLERAVQMQALTGVRGLGPRLNERLARELRVVSTEEKRWLRPVARQFAEPLVAHLREVPGVQEVVVAGSYRRGRETVGDLDLLVSASDAAAVVQALHRYEEIASWAAEGARRVTVILHGGLQVDLRVTEPGSFGAALHYFTGSKAHNIHLRRMAQDRGLKVNEYGVFRGRKQVAGDTTGGAGHAAHRPGRGRAAVLPRAGQPARPAGPGRQPVSPGAGAGRAGEHRERCAPWRAVRQPGIRRGAGAPGMAGAEGRAQRQATGGTAQAPARNVPLAPWRATG